MKKRLSYSFLVAGAVLVLGAGCTKDVVAPQTNNTPANNQNTTTQNTNNASTQTPTATETTTGAELQVNPEVKIVVPTPTPKTTVSPTTKPAVKPSTKPTTNPTPILDSQASVVPDKLPSYEDPTPKPQYDANGFPLNPYNMQKFYDPVVGETYYYVDGQWTHEDYVYPYQNQ